MQIYHTHIYLHKHTNAYIYTRIQLFHVKSEKYLTVSGSLAKDERENMMVTLNTNGNIYSWLQVCPRYKIDREGDKIRNKSEVYLKVSERSNEYIHRADRDPLLGTGNMMMMMIITIRVMMMMTKTVSMMMTITMNMS